jgi:hypothetical protein
MIDNYSFRPAPTLIPISHHQLDALLLEREQHVTQYRYFINGEYHWNVGGRGIEELSEQSVHTTLGCREGHRGVWFYDPAVTKCTLRAGDVVRFVDANDPDKVYAEGTVLEEVEPKDHPKVCSGVNHKGFRWE